jgi:hypothetical protein
MQLNYTQVNDKRSHGDAFYIVLLVYFTDKQPFKAPDEIVKDPSVGAINSSAAIIKSASTPASLQTIVRFSNGSNMSLQHKVNVFKVVYLHFQ